MATRIWGLVLSGVFLCGMGLWVSIRAANTSSPEETTNPALEQPGGKPSEAAPADIEVDPPKAVAETKFYNFGIVDPKDLYVHDFVIRNEGTGPLRIGSGGTSCKCAEAQYPKDPVLPGEEGKVAVGLRLPGMQGEFSYRVTVRTNDPKTSSIDLLTTGVIRTILAAQPPSVEMKCMVDSSATGAVVLYSQVWDDFTIENPRCSVEGVTWEFHPIVDEARLKKLGARSAKRVEITVPARDSYGWYAANLEFTAKAKGESKVPSKSMTIRVSQVVLKKVRLHCTDYDTHLGELDLGSVHSRDGIRKRMVLMLHDGDPSLPVREIQVRPESLKVNITPMSTSGGTTGIYAIDMEIPPGSPPCDCQTEKGFVHIVTDHPRVKDIEFKVRVVVFDR